MPPLGSFRLAIPAGWGRLPHGFLLDRHQHTQGLLLWAAAGALATTTERGTWVAPANRVTWTPPGFEHTHRSFGDTNVRLVVIPRDLCGALPKRPGVCSVNPLLRETSLALTPEVERRHCWT